MSENETFFTPFQTIDEQEFADFTRKMDKNTILVIPKSILYFVTAAFSKTILNFFSKKITLEDSLKPSNGVMSILVPCLDDPELLLYLLDKLQVVPQYKKHILIMPRFSPHCQAVFENSPISRGIQITEFHLDILPLSPENFLVPLKNAFTNIYCDYDISDAYTIAKALVKFELINGKCARTFSAGNVSQMVISLMKEMEEQVGTSYFQTKNAKYDDLFIIDRTCDNVTPFITQGTYGGMIDDTFNPEYNFMKLPNGVRFEKAQDSPHFKLDQNDLVYQEIKDK